MKFAFINVLCSSKSNPAPPPASDDFDDFFNDAPSETHVLDDEDDQWTSSTSTPKRTDSKGGLDDDWDINANGIVSALVPSCSLIY